jgi:FKBP-type peptidyl-prolyl cis-trans isomerase FkpA
VRDAQAGKPGVALDEWGPKVQSLAGARAGRVTAREKVASAAFLTKAASATGAVRTDSGIVYTELTAGGGASPQASDRVRVHYRGTLTNGTEFDSSYARNEPAEFPLGGVIKCWTEGVQRMKVGGKARLVCPSDLAYGDAGNSAIPGGSALVFEVELLGIVEAEPAAP